MKQYIGLREINQHLAQYISEVEGGQEIIITRRGQPIARLIGVTTKYELTNQQKSAWKRTQARMQKGFDLGGETFDRESLYDD